MVVEAFALQEEQLDLRLVKEKGGLTRRDFIVFDFRRDRVAHISRFFATLLGEDRVLPPVRSKFGMSNMHPPSAFSNGVATKSFATPFAGKSSKANVEVISIMVLCIPVDQRSIPTNSTTCLTKYLCFGPHRSPDVFMLEVEPMTLRLCIL